MRPTHNVKPRGFRYGERVDNSVNTQAVRWSHMYFDCLGRPGLSDFSGYPTPGPSSQNKAAALTLVLPGFKSSNSGVCRSGFSTPTISLSEDIQQQFHQRPQRIANGPGNDQILTGTKPRAQGHFPNRARPAPKSASSSPPSAPQCPA